MLVAMLTAAFAAFADTINWNYDSTAKTLYISGSGNMDNYTDSSDTPWNDYMTQMERIVVSDGVKSLGNTAFAGANKLTAVELASSVTAIGDNTFASCPLVTVLSASGTFLLRITV